MSPLNTTISMAPGIPILVEKLENITFGGCQVNSTPTQCIAVLRVNYAISKRSQEHEYLV